MNLQPQLMLRLNNFVLSSSPCFRTVVLLLACVSSTAWAASVRFDIPAQSAAAALVMFAKQAGVDVLFSSTELKDVRTNAVTGEFEIDEALNRLLRSTGFTAERAKPGKYIVRRERRAKAAVGGTVVGAMDGAPIDGASVRVIGSTAAARTRNDGTFVLSSLPNEALSLAIQAEGFAPLVVSELRLSKERQTHLGTLRLVPRTDGPQQLEQTVVKAGELGGLGPPFVSLDAFIVTPSRFRLDEEHGAYAAALTGSDLQALPQLGDDLYRAISHLPGIATDDVTARFWVRGAPHDQLLARLDGVELIEPFHLQDTKSSLSILDLETISRLDLCTGGFSAEFGDKLAAVLSMETAAHTRPKPHTTIGLSLTGVRVASRGRSSDGRSSWLVSARSGYPDLALETAVDEDDEIRPSYHDVMGKWELQLNPQNVLSFHALHSGDRMHFRDSAGPVLTSAYRSDYQWARWRADFGGIRGETVLSHVETSWRRDASGLRDRFFGLQVNDRRGHDLLGFRQDWNALVSEKALLRAGFELKEGDAEYRYVGFRDVAEWGASGYQLARIDRSASASREGTSSAAYASARFRPLSFLAVESGIRHDANSHAGDRDWSPRLNAAIDGGATTVRLAWGVYHQAHGLHQLGVADGEMEYHRSERAEHRIASVEHRMRNGVMLRLEGYERITTRPQPRWQNLIDNFDAVPELATHRVRLEPVRASARGIELIAERRANEKLTWSAAYAFSRSEDTLGSGRRVPRFRDQRHTFSLDVGYSPNARWRFSSAFLFHSGWPVTERTFSLHPYVGGGHILLADTPVPYTARLPSYHRLDFRVQRTFQLPRGTLRAYLDVFNALNKRNVINYGYQVDISSSGAVTTTRKPGDRLLPLMPSVGLIWDF